MPATNPPGGAQPPEPAAPHRTLWALLVFVLVLLVLLVGASLVYVTWRHPALAAPLAAAFAGVTLLVTIAFALARR
ncbi:hypothetical protein [Streptomyces flavofungini]|uniref:hypothetical protein n=1 Tax=Streptomyces flavofungini TaxID=68200 RepID=UPI0025B13190|nr:hypothetical protein [Streptomyces flavofungini]WJV51710.1 hypothetical protein QUY26_40330 [Streptomyces flavofungini]